MGKVFFFAAAAKGCTPMCKIKCRFCIYILLNVQNLKIVIFPKNFFCSNASQDDKNYHLKEAMRFNVLFECHTHKRVLSVFIFTHSFVVTDYRITSRNIQSFASSFLSWTFSVTFIESCS